MEDEIIATRLESLDFQITEFQVMCEKARGLEAGDLEDNAMDALESILGMVEHAPDCPCHPQNQPDRDETSVIGTVLFEYSQEEGHIRASLFLDGELVTLSDCVDVGKEDAALPVLVENLEDLVAKLKTRLG